MTDPRCVGCVALLLVAPLAREARAAEPAPLGLEQAQAIALEANFGLRQSRIEIAQARSARMRSSAQRRLPELELSVGAESGLSAFSVFDTTGARHLLDQESTAADGALLLTQPLPFQARLELEGSGVHRQRAQEQADLPIEVDGIAEARLAVPLLDRSGSLDDADRQAALDLEQARLDHDAALADLRVQVVESYYGLVRAQGLLGIRARSHEASRTQAERAQEKFAAGLIAEGDLLQLEVARDLSEASLITSRGGVARTREALNDVLGRAASAPLAVRAEVPPPPPVELEPERLLERALERREEIRGARLATESARLTARGASSARGINGELELGAGLRGNGHDLRSAYQGRQAERSARLSFDWALWDGARGRRLVDEARAEVERSSLAEEQARRRVTLDLRAQIRRYREARVRARVLERAESAATRAYEIALIRFEAGSIDSQRLLQEEDARRRAESDRLNAVIDVHLALAALERAVMGPIEELGGA